MSDGIIVFVAEKNNKEGLFRREFYPLGKFEQGPTADELVQARRELEWYVRHTLKARGYKEAFLLDKFGDSVAECLRRIEL